MATNYQKSYATDFGSSLLPHQLVDELNDEAGITPTCNSVSKVNDVVTIRFAAALSGAEQTTMDTVISNHAPVIYETLDLTQIVSSNQAQAVFPNGNKIFIPGNYSKTLWVSQESGTGAYSSIKAACTAAASGNYIIMVHPGIYVEDNPITVPANTLMQSTGTTKQTTIVAMNAESNILDLNPWCEIRNFVLTGCTGSGAAAVYFDGSIDGTGSFSLLANSIISNCDVGMETDNGPDTLLANRVLITASSTGSQLSKGVYAHSGGQFISSSMSIVGVPSPPYPTGVPVDHAIMSTGAGTKISMTTSNVLYCNHATTLDNNGELELQLLTATGNAVGICVGGTGTESKLRATLYNLIGSTSYDMDIQATDANITLSSSDMTKSKINNPNEVKMHANFHTTENGKKYNNLTGNIIIGDSNLNSKLVVGEGQYDDSHMYVCLNDNLEVGTWTNVTEAVTSYEGSTFNYFAGTDVGNCMYIGSLNPMIGMKTHVVTGITTDAARGDIAWEYWDGSSWTEFKVSDHETTEPYYGVDTCFLNNDETKYHIRFGLKKSANYADKLLNGETKKWMRLRVVNALASIPVGEYIKLHLSETKINDHGYIEHFGNSRPVKKLAWNANDSEPANASPGNRDLYLSDKLGVGLQENLFENNKTDRLGFIYFLPPDFDRSFPVKLKFAIVGNSGTDGNVEMTARWNTTGPGSTIYDTTSQSPTTSPGELSETILINVTEADQEYRGEFSLDLNDINPAPSDGHQKILWVAIERDGASGPDTYSGNIAIIQMQPLYVSWREGGHIEDF